MLNETQLADFELSESSRREENKDRDRDRDSVSKGDRSLGRKDRVNVASEVCGLCDVSHRNANKLLMCRKFLEMKLKERCDLGRHKKKCLQCLDGIAKWNDKDHMKNCSNRWVCQNSAHAGYDRKLHFLTCEAHAGEPANMTLFERFKEEVLKAEWQLRVFRGMSGILYALNL